MFRADNMAVCVSPMCQRGLLFREVYAPSRHQMLFLPDKCQVVWAISPIPLWILLSNFVSLGVGSCQGFCIYAHLSLPNVGNTGTAQILPAPFVSLAQLWLSAGLLLLLSVVLGCSVISGPYSINRCAVEFSPCQGTVFQSRNHC